MVELAQELQERFCEFVGKNKDITLSAGIASVKPRYPLGQAAVYAENLLKKAKREDALERETPEAEEAKGRDQVAVLGDVLTWDAYQMVLNEQETLQRDRPHSAFLYNLLRYANMWRQFVEENDTNGLRFQPMLAYNITRNVDRRRQPTLRAWAERLVKIKLDKEARNVLHHLGVIVQLALFKTQKRGNQS